MLENMTHEQNEDFVNLLRHMVRYCQARYEEEDHDNYSIVIEVLDDKIFETAHKILEFED